MTSKLTTIKQSELDRAKYAYDCVNKVKDKEFKGNYKSYVKKIPTLIQVNGLAGTFAFVFSKKGEGSKQKEAYRTIYQQVDKWLKKNYKNNDETELIEWIITRDPKLYKAITIEVLALFSWLRRFAEGMIEGEEANEQE